MIRINNISKKYGDKNVLENLNMELPETGLVAVIGKSGLGKTTLLNILAGLETADSGIITGLKEATISMVFQEDRLLINETALANASISAYSRNLKMKQANNEYQTEIKFKTKQLDNENRADIKFVENKAKKILEELGLGTELDTRVSELSGGMARRVAIARALVREADVYLMDEPIRGLDKESAALTMHAIRKYTDGKLLVLVSHNPDETALADMIIKL